MERSNEASTRGGMSTRQGLILLIAYGNSLRGDDGAGFALAEKLENLLHQANRGVVRIDAHQLTPELSLDIAARNVSAAIFLDTRAVSDPADDLKIHCRRITPAEFSSPSIGHQMDASVLLAYTSHLFKAAPPAWLITIPGVKFDHGEELSETTRNALKSIPDSLMDLIDLLSTMP